MATPKKRYHPEKWTGVYVYELAKTFEGAPDQCFYITYKLGGRLVWEKIGRISEGFGPEKAAALREQRLKALNSSKTEGEVRKKAGQQDKSGKRPPLRISKLADMYFAERGPKLLGLVKDKNRYQKHLASRFGWLTVENIHPGILESLEISLQEEGRSVSTLWNCLELLQRIINFGHRTGRCPALSFPVKMPARTHSVTECLEPEQIERFLAVLDSWPGRDVANMLRLAFFTGLRRGEIFELRSEDLDFERQGMRIRSLRSNKSTTVAMSKVAEDILREQIVWRDAHYPQSEYVFPGRNGGRRKDCSAVNTIRKAAQLPDTFRPFHGLRDHFAVTRAHSGKLTLSVLAEMLAYQSTAFARQRYGEFFPEPKKSPKS